MRPVAHPARPSRPRSGWTEHELAAREAAQWPEHVKKARADAIIVNDSDLESPAETGG